MLLFKTSTKFILLSFVLICFLGCIEDPTGNSNNDTTIPNNNFIENFGQSATHNFIGQVVDLQNNPVVGASILVGSSTTTTDSNGIFIVRNAEVFDKFAYVKAKKAGFINGSRSLVPSSGFNHIKIMLLPKTVTQTVSSGVPTTVNLSNGAAVELLGNYSKLDGTIYTGNVQISLHFLNPSENSMTEQMPGMLLGQNYQNQARILRTLGMLAVDLRSEAGEKLNISDGSEATISVPLDPETLNGAPNQIPLWYFDEDNGYWIEEGFASLQGSKYIGTVSHFSFWNCDIPTEYVNICIKISDSNNTALSNINVGIQSEFNGTTYGTTNESGEVCGIIPANQILNLSYYFNGICNNGEIPGSSQTFGPFNQDVSLDIILDAPEVEEYLETITGIFNTCNGDQVSNGYVEGTIEGGSNFYSIVTDGVFEISVLSCNENSTLTISGYDYDNTQTTGEISYTLTSPETNLGNLYACDSVDEFIQYSIDGGDLEYILSNITVQENGQFGLEIQYFGQDNNSNWGDCFWLSINLNPNYPNNEGEYQYGEFSFIETCPVYPDYNANNEIILNLNSYGTTVGDYIDIDFGGSYFDYQGNPHTINGVVHVKRDN